jgi:hypothetical protein
MKIVINDLYNYINHVNEVKLIKQFKEKSNIKYKIKTKYDNEIIYYTISNAWILYYNNVHYIEYIMSIIENEIVCNYLSMKCKYRLCTKFLNDKSTIKSMKKIIKKNIQVNESVYLLTSRFFFNYLHALIEGISNLYNYFELKKYIPALKLGVYEGHSNFVYDLINCTIINKNDIFICKPHFKYDKVYFSSILTRKFNGIKNEHTSMYKNEIYEVYDKIINNINNNINNDIINNINKIVPIYYDRIYISRRTWIHNDLSNIGSTNTTQSRKILNEDEVVELLTTKYNFTEIFGETIDTEQKVKLLNNCKYIICPVGSGIANIVFCKKTTKIMVINNQSYNINYLIDTHIKRYKNIIFKDIGKATTNDIKPPIRPWTININKLENEIISFLQ